MEILPHGSPILNCRIYWYGCSRRVGCSWCNLRTSANHSDLVLLYDPVRKSIISPRISPADTSSNRLALFMILLESSFENTIRPNAELFSLGRQPPGKSRHGYRNIH